MNDALEEARRAFYAGERTTDSHLCIEDSVEVEGTKYAGRQAAVISVESIGSDPRYLIEFGDTGEDAVIPLSSLKRLES